MKQPGGTPRRCLGVGCTMTVIATTTTAAVTVTAAATTMVTAADDDIDNIDETLMAMRVRTTDDLAMMGAGKEGRTWQRWHRLRQARRLQMITAGQGA